MKLNAIFMTAALGMNAFPSTSLGAELNPLNLTPHHATISVADLDKESQWYATVLGFEKSKPRLSPKSARGTGRKMWPEV